MKFAPVKNPTGKQVRAKIVNNEGKPHELYISDEVAGKLHIITTCRDAWIDIAELREALRLLSVTE